MSERWSRIGRWAALLPASVIGAWAAWWLVSLVNRLGYWRMAGEPPGPRMATVLDGWTHWVLGFVFVYLVATIAPSHKRIAAIVAAACVVLMAGVIIGMAVTAADYRALPTMALVLGGAVVSCVVLHRRDAYESA